MEPLEISRNRELKKQIVEELKNKIENSRTVLIASIKGLPSFQFQKIKKNLKGKAEIKVFKKSLLNLALKKINKGSIQNLKNYFQADIAIFFSQLDAFELSALLSESQIPAKAKAGDIAPSDIRIEEGPTELMPGPAISELSSVGLKVAVENGKLSIKKSEVVAKKGDIIDEKLASVLGKLNINPMKVGFIPIVAYDSIAEKIYTNIRINKQEVLEKLKEAINKSLGFAINRGYICDKTISYFIAKAGLEEKAIYNTISKNLEGGKND